MGKLTLERLREVLHYEPDTGVFTWRVSLSNRAPVGSVAGSTDSQGYTTIRIDGKMYSAAALAWAYVTGEFADNLVDHKSRDRTDNRFDNLRPATVQQNAFNASAHKDNKSGLKGVHRHFDGRWRAQLYQGGKRHHLGLFYTPEEAHQAYVQAAAMHFGEYATDGGISG